MTSVRAGLLCLLAFLVLLANGVAQTEASAPASKPPEIRAGLKLPEIRLHDPCIVADPITRRYYLYTSAPARLTGTGHTGTFAYRSENLDTWEGPYVVFTVPPDTWADPAENAWAPEVVQHDGRFYLFTTLHNPKKPIVSTNSVRPNHLRATVVAVSDSPLGPFTMLKKDAPVTPPEFMTIDGTLFVDENQTPWLVYVHEWIQKNDGTIEAMPLTKDLTSAAGAPIFLMKGSDAPWIAAQAVPNAKGAIYVTDGPQFYRTKTGVLLMLWSSYERNSFGWDSYVETVARSKSGKLEGPWEQLGPLVGNDSGHGMLFRTFEGQLMLIIHQPFLNARGKLYEIEDLGDNVKISRYRNDLSGPPLPPQRGQKPQ